MKRSFESSNSNASANNIVTTSHSENLTNNITSDSSKPIEKNTDYSIDEKQSSCDKSVASNNVSDELEFVIAKPCISDLVIHLYIYIYIYIFVKLYIYKHDLFACEPLFSSIVSEVRLTFRNACCLAL